MPSVDRPGKVAVYAEIPKDLKDAFTDYAESVGSDLREQLELAMRRHLAYPPPPPEVPPLPDGKKPRRRQKD